MITRSMFLKTAAAALAGKLVPAASATTKPPVEKPLLVTMAELLTVELGYVNRSDFPAAEVGLLVELQGCYKKNPFPVPDWLAKHRLWAGFIEDERRKAEGTYCAYGEGPWSSTCPACGDHIGEGEPRHYYKATEAEEMKVYHLECCPACIKAGRTPAEGARAHRRQVRNQRSHYCASHESGPHGRCHECGRFMSKTEPRHVDARGDIYHPKCCRPCEWRPAGEPNELPA